jgi:formylmethanofuran dehydrogenase subunit E
LGDSIADARGRHAATVIRRRRSAARRIRPSNRVSRRQAQLANLRAQVWQRIFPSATPVRDVDVRKLA